MLAVTWETGARTMRYPAYAQPKLDGLRAVFSGTTGEFTSRTGVRYNVPTIAAATRALLAAAGASAPSAPLDGELYAHGMSLQAIQSAVAAGGVTGGGDADARGGGPPLLAFWVYDVVNVRAPFSERAASLASLARAAARLPPAQRARVHIVDTRVVASEAAFCAAADAWIDGDGYEGAMLRSATGRYEAGKRSSHLVKYKRFADAEFRVVGFSTDRLGRVKWRCETSEGVPFDVSPAGAHADAIAAAATAASRVGAWLTIKYVGWTDSGKPRNATSLGFRDDGVVGMAAAPPAARPLALAARGTGKRGRSSSTGGQPAPPKRSRRSSSPAASSVPKGKRRSARPRAAPASSTTPTPRKRGRDPRRFAAADAAAPKTMAERRALAEHCGASTAFLQPDTLKYPIVPYAATSAPAGTGCTPSRDLVTRALVLSRMHHARDVTEAAEALLAASRGGR